MNCVFDRRMYDILVHAKELNAHDIRLILDFDDSG